MPTPLDLLLDPVSLAVFALFALLYVWERLFPARVLPEVPGWWLRGLLSFVVYFFVSAYVPLLIAGFVSGLRVADASGLGTVGGALLALFVYEGLGYAWHRALHGSPFLWRVFHQMHHSAERIDVPSAFWFSPLDMVGWTLVTTLALSLVGLTPGATVLFVMITTFFSIFQHANVRTPMWLGYFVQRPENHSHHHARDVHGGNYANLSVFDIAFGTFANHADFAREIGLGEGASSRVPEMLVFRDVSTR